MSTLIRVASALGIFTLSANAGVNCKTLWMEPNIESIRSSESIPYTVIELNGIRWRGEVTHHARLKVTSSDESIVAVDQKAARLIGRAPGRAEIRVTFGECTTFVNVLSK